MEVLAQAPLELCPDLRDAASLRTVSRVFRHAFGLGAQCALLLADRRLCHEDRLSRAHTLLRDRHIKKEAARWAAVLCPTLLDTVESFASHICPHARFWADEALLAEQVGLTLELLERHHAAEIRYRPLLRRMIRCNELVAAVAGRFFAHGALGV